MSAQRGPQETAAHQYADVGWPVFPCRPGTKEPATRNGFYDATTGHRQIERWWSAQPDRNVAIATGAPGPDVLDVDNHGEHDNGFGTLNHLKRDGRVDGYHAVVQTPSGGLHLYYRGTSQGNGSIRGYRLDFRSRGGYVVAPPSATPAGQYVVAKHAPTTAAGTVSWDAIQAELSPRPQAPAWRPERHGEPSTSVDRLVEWTARRQAGDRNFPLFWAAKQAHLAGQLDGEAVERFVDAARRSGLEGGEREARRTIASAQRSADREARPFAASPGACPAPAPESHRQAAIELEQGDMSSTETRAHGTRARYVHGPGPGQGEGCSCGRCTEANRAWNANRDRLMAYGRWQPYVDAEPVREHLRKLSAAGLGWRRVVELTGKSSGLVTRILYGGPGGRPPARRVRPETAEAILQIEPSPAQLAPGALTPAIGTQRRMQALIATGRTQTELAAALGQSVQNFGAMMRRDHVTAETDQAARALYDRLWNKPPPETGHRERIAAARARNYAAQRGWAPPAAWDDDAIDDPAGTPAEGWKRPARTTHRSADLAEDATELLEGQGYTRDQAAARLGVSPAALGAALRRTAAGREYDTARHAEQAAVRDGTERQRTNQEEQVGLKNAAARAAGAVRSRRARPYEAATAEANRLWAIADELDKQIGRQPGYQHELTAERAARIRAQIGEDLSRDARREAEAESHPLDWGDGPDSAAPRVPADGPALQGAALDAEIDRLAEAFPEPESGADMPQDRRSSPQPGPSYSGFGMEMFGEMHEGVLQAEADDTARLGQPGGYPALYGGQHQHQAEAV